MIGIGRTMKHVITVDDLYAAHFKAARHDGKREWILCLACINALERLCDLLLSIRGYLVISMTHGYKISKRGIVHVSL